MDATSKVPAAPAKVEAPAAKVDVAGAKNVIDKSLNFLRPLEGLQEAAQAILTAHGDLANYQGQVATEQQKLADLKAAGLKELAAQEAAARTAKAAAEKMVADAKTAADTIVNRAAQDAAGVNQGLVEKRKTLKALEERIAGATATFETDRAQIEATLLRLRGEEQAIRDRAAAMMAR